MTKAAAGNSALLADSTTTGSSSGAGSLTLGHWSGPKPNHATFDMRIDHVRHGHVPKRPDCPICQAADPVVRHVKGATEPQPGVLHCDVCGPFEEASDKGEKLLLVMALRVLNKDWKLVLLTQCVSLVHKRAAEVTPAI
eukprot:6156490-Amphidinium_carterae.1